MWLCEEATAGKGTSKDLSGPKAVCCSLPPGVPVDCVRGAANLGKKQKLECGPHLLNRQLTAHWQMHHPPAHPSSASVSRSSRPFRFSALTMVGRGTRSTSGLSGRIGRLTPSLFSFLMTERRVKTLSWCQVHRWKQTQILLQNYVPQLQRYTRALDIIIPPSFKKHKIPPTV